MNGRITCLVACLLSVSIPFDGAIRIAHCRFAAAGSVFPALGIVWGAFNLPLLSHTRSRCWAKHFVPYTAQVVMSFADGSAQERRHAGDRDALW